MVKLGKKDGTFQEGKKKKGRKEERRTGRENKRKENGNTTTFKNLESNFKILEVKTYGWA